MANPHHRTDSHPHDSLEDKYARAYVVLLVLVSVVIVAFPVAFKIILPIVAALAPSLPSTEKLVDWLDSSFVPIMVTSTAGLVVLLVRPVLRISRNTSGVDVRFADLKDSVLRYESVFPAVLDEKLSMLSDVIVRDDEWKDDTDIISDFVKQNHLVWSYTYLGADIPALTRALFALAARDQNHELYIHPRVLPQLGSATIGAAKIFVTDCPREACVLFGGRSPSRRKGKLGLIVRSEDRGKTFWSATLTANSNYVTYLEKTFRNHYQGEPAVSLDSSAKARFLSKLYSVRVAENEDVFNGFLAFSTWEKEYEFAADVIAEARTVHAVDFMPPDAWDPDPLSDEPMERYIESHNKIAGKAERQRVHVFSARELGGQGARYSRAKYEKYIELHNRLGVKLCFIGDIHVKFGGGFLIIDNNMVFYEKETQFKATTKKENCASFKPDDVRHYSGLFAKLRTHRCLMDAERFLEHIESGRERAATREVSARESGQDMQTGTRDDVAGGG